MAFPDFLIIGAQKAGTSWLAANLSRHPDVWTPPLKELHYFDERIKEPSFGASIIRLSSKRYTDEDWYPWYWRYQLKYLLQRRFRRDGRGFDPETLFWAIKFFLGSPSDRWYASLFEQGRGKTIGEATPEYAILDEGAIAHVHELMPSAKVVFFMRNPIERPYSSALMRIRTLKGMGRNSEVTADKAFFEGFFREPVVVSETKYLESLEKWRRFYPDEQIFVGFLEDLHLHPVRLLRRLYRFLGVDPSQAWMAERSKINPGCREKMPTRLAAHLARTYHEDLRRLSTRFGGYAHFWLHCAERLTYDTPKEETIPYPLWESWMWEEWTIRSRSSTPVDAQDGEEVQSGSLASFQRREEKISDAKDA